MNSRPTDYIDINDPNHSAIYSHARARRDKKEFVLYFSKNSGQLNKYLDKSLNHGAKKVQFSMKRLAQTTKSLNRTNAKKPSSEVLIKIDRQAVAKGGGTQKHVINYADYISRKGNVEVYTSDGLIIDNLEDLKEYGEDFIEGQKDLKGLRDTNERLAVNMILSMNDFYVKDVEDFKKATEKFIKEEIINNEFECFYAFHDDTNNPHCHVTVGYRSDTGKRFDFNVKDINRMRERYAESLNEHNIEATATARWVRGEMNKSIHRDKYFALLRQPIMSDQSKVNFEKTANIFVEETFNGNKLVYQDVKDQFSIKRNETIIDFAYQLANEAKKHNNAKVADSFYTYATSLKKRHEYLLKKGAKAVSDINLKDIDTSTVSKAKLENKVQQAQINKILKYSFTLSKEKQKSLRFGTTEQVLTKDGKLYASNIGKFAKEFNKEKPKDRTAIVFEVSNFNIEGLKLPVKADIIVNDLKDKGGKRVMILADKTLSKQDKFKAIKAFNQHIQKNKQRLRKRKSIKELKK